MLLFLMTTIVFALTPGPAMIYTASQAVARGRKAGFQAALGIHLASYLHITFAATGVSIILHDSPLLFHFLKILGCAYLVGLGLSALLLAPREDIENHRPETKQRPVLNAFSVELFNPKSALFFLSFLPQFAAHAPPAMVALQTFLYGCAANVVFSLAEIVVVLASEKTMLLLGGDSTRKIATRRASGLIMISLGAHLAFQQM